MSSPNSRPFVAQRNICSGSLGCPGVHFSPRLAPRLCAPWAHGPSGTLGAERSRRSGCAGQRESKNPEYGGTPDPRDPHPHLLDGVVAVGGQLRVHQQVVLAVIAPRPDPARSPLRAAPPGRQRGAPAHSGVGTRAGRQAGCWLGGWVAEWLLGVPGEEAREPERGDGEPRARAREPPPACTHAPSFYVNRASSPRPSRSHLPGDQ